MLKKIVVTLLFVLGIIVFGDVPHSYIWDNPEKEVTQTETLKRHKDKAELNISVTKLKSEPIAMKHSTEEKKFFFELTEENVKRSDGAIKLEPTDRIFVSEKLEEVPSVSTTNGRRKINTMKKLNKSLDKGTLKNGNLTWTVKDLMTAESKKVVEVEYGTFPKELYVGITDKDYNLKKVFRGKMEDLELYSIDYLAGYVTKYDEVSEISSVYEYDISDIVMWTRDNNYVDIKFAEMNMASIKDMSLIQKGPYLAVGDANGNGVPVNLLRDGTSTVVATGTLHIVDRSESSLLPLTTEENLKSRINASVNFQGTATKELKTAVYLRLRREDFSSLAEGEYVLNHTGIYGYDVYRWPLQLPELKVHNRKISETRRLTVDFWLFGTDFPEKVNYVIDPRNNSTGNLKIRVQDENGSILDAVSAGRTDSVFDIQGARPVKFDFDDNKIKVEVVGEEGFYPTVQNQGSFYYNRNRWADGVIPGYGVQARIWSDYDGIELDFRKDGPLSTANDGIRKFKIKVTHTENGRSTLLQEITVNLYVNNTRIQDRPDYFPNRFSDIDISFPEQKPEHSKDNVFNLWRNEKWTALRHTADDPSQRNKPYNVTMIGPEGDLRDYFPFAMSRGLLMKYMENGDKNYRWENKFFVEDIENKCYFSGASDGYYMSKSAGNGVQKLTLVHHVLIPRDMTFNEDTYVVYYEGSDWDGTDLYYDYGRGKRRNKARYQIRIMEFKKFVEYSHSAVTRIEGIPLLTNGTDGANTTVRGQVYKRYNNMETTNDNQGWITGTFHKEPLYDETQFFVDQYPAIRDNVGKNRWKYVNWKLDTKDLWIYIRPNDHPSYLYSSFGLKRWYLSNSERKLGELFAIAGRYEVGSGGGQRSIEHLEIRANPFDATFMWDRNHSSIKDANAVIKELDMRRSYEPTKQIIEIGEVYFRHLNIKALRQNTNRKPVFVLPDSAYLVYSDGREPNNRINVSLSFSQTVGEKSFQMQDQGGDYAGGNGKKVYMHIEVDEYKKMLRNGPGKEYILKANYSNNAEGVPNESNTTGVIKVGVIATTDPDGRTRYEPFFRTTLNRLIVMTKDIEPMVYTIKYSHTEPLIAGYDMQIVKNNIKYTDMPSGYDYNRNVSIIKSGSVELEPYDFFIRAHTYQIVEANGRIRNGQIASAGSGTHWDDLNLGPHKATLYHKKDFGEVNVGGTNYQIRELTFFKLKEYNSYDAYRGKIIEKHYKPYSRNIHQYYEINVDIPEFDPYIYLKENQGDEDTINRSTKREIQRVGKRIYYLGTVRTKSEYDVEITKNQTPGIVDNYGLRVVPNTFRDKRGVVFYEVDRYGGTGNPHPTRGRIVFLDSNNNELSYSMSSPNYMVGKGQEIRVGIEIPADLNPGIPYRVLGRTNVILDKDSDIPENNFNLAIGRNKYFKELIEEIYFKEEKLIGKFTIKFNNNYTIREMAKFKSTNFTERAPVDFAPPRIPGVEIQSREGEGFLQLESGDILQVEIENKGPMVFFNIDSSLKAPKQEILLNDNVTKMAFKIEDGKVQMGLNYWKPNSTNKVIFRVIRNGNELMYQEMTLLTPDSQFIVTHKEDLDFGNVFQGTRNNYAESSLGIENTGDIAEVGFEISNTRPILENVNDETKKLQVKEINAALFRKEPKKYELRVNGFLDVPEGATIGEYKGSITIKLDIK